MDKISERRGFVISFLYFAVILLICYIFLKYLLGVVLPFVLGLLISAILCTPARFLNLKFHFKERFAAVICVLVFYGTIGTALAFAAVKLITALGNIFMAMPGFYSENIAPAISELSLRLQHFIASFDASGASGVGSFFSNFELSLTSAVSAVSVKAVGFASELMANVPSLAVSVVFTVIATFFIAADYQRITGFLLKLIPEGKRDTVISAKSCLVKILAKYLRSYSLIFLITFAELFLGLSLIGIKKAFAAALFTAAVDILPVFGSGAVLLPWAVISLLGGDTRRGVMLLVLYGIMAVIRNIIEPKIVGREVGIHPTLTLFSMYVGTKLFGFAGLLIFPIGLSLAKSLRECGHFELNG